MSGRSYVRLPALSTGAVGLGFRVGDGGVGRSALDALNPLSLIVTETSSLWACLEIPRPVRCAILPC